MGLLALGTPFNWPQCSLYYNNFFRSPHCNYLEYGRFMLESNPGKPYGPSLEDCLKVK
ncbi:uncharacterized protein MELLADRAFT_93096 [Melampsora larici-populina 98AG31]|uniref:Uncharacterized protein n=1 Tax=Melampsora larici-populina (strain 98AG31 / pathotype 3-4-7) TaxID=747676 RepID=F4S3X9_MELLP|nr:uncharacterized protein MELLADRAFT_93096 [Melampsora larici-populina 98AG31]EGG00611.1 hypothetical protein MELLADRAFT_93096 [Melampsora larici-populina 98AG31]